MRFASSFLVGAMSFFTDFTCEGARGIAGPNLALLGASGAAVGAEGVLRDLVGGGRPPPA